MADSLHPAIAAFEAMPSNDRAVIAHHVSQQPPRGGVVASEYAQPAAFAAASHSEGLLKSFLGVFRMRTVAMAAAALVVLQVQKLGLSLDQDATATALQSLGQAIANGANGLATVAVFMAAIFRAVSTGETHR